MKFSKITHKKGTKWNVDLAFIITFYDAYVREKSLRKVAASLEMRCWNLQNLISRYPELQQAKEMADQNRGKAVLGNYVLKQMSAPVRKAWDKLQTASTLEEIELIFKRKQYGTQDIKLRQQLFCQALLHTGYDVSKACQMVGIDRKQMSLWRDDLDFLQMLEEVQFHKKNFFENALIGLCSDLHPGAVIFANRTINADRGYTEKLQVEHTGKILGSRTDFDIGELDLDLETQKKVLAAIEKWKAEHGAEPQEDEDGEEPSTMQTQAMTLVR